MRILSIDPSINSCGIAIFNGKRLSAYTLLRPRKEQLVEGDYVEKSRSIFSQICEQVEKDKIERIILEIPENWGVSGYISRESGSLFKLVFVCGMIASLNNVVTVTPSGWKKQLPKDVVQRRLQVVYPNLVISKMDHNVVDGIGIGHWYVYGAV